jgi:hypothetical protein
MQVQTALDILSATTPSGFNRIFYKNDRKLLNGGIGNGYVRFEKTLLEKLHAFVELIYSALRLLTYPINLITNVSSS